MTNPFEISVSVKLRNCNFKPCVLNVHRSKTEDIIKLPFLNFKNNTSDLNITLSTDSSPDNTYVIGSKPIIMLHIDIYNRGDPAYQTEVRIFIENLILASILPDCIEDSRIDSTLNVICDVSDLPSKTKVRRSFTYMSRFYWKIKTNPLNHFIFQKRLTLELDMSMVRYDVKKIKLKALISTESSEINLDDNSHVIAVYFEYIALKITGLVLSTMWI